MKNARSLMAVALAVVLGCSASAGAFVSTELVVNGLQRPLYLTSPPGDDRLFVLEQRGLIRIVKDGSLLSEPFMDLSAVATDPSGYSEQGLLGLTFDHDYAANGFFYVHYTDNDGDTVIERYKVDSGNPDIADPATAVTVVTQSQPYGNHNGGTIDFGPDGYLYFGFGDGGSGGDPGNRAQDPTTLLGKMIRIDVSSLPYTIPPDNPYAGSTTLREEIWASGLRNPYRWSFDRDTGDLWIGDVGQQKWEEVDFQSSASSGGENYGWRLMEGNHCYNPPTDCGSDTLALPIHEYGHTGGNCSITGGHVYRGTAIPELEGHYVFGDYCSARVWALEYDGQDVVQLIELTQFVNGDGRVGALTAVSEDDFGELYLIDGEGDIYRIIRDPSAVDNDDVDTGAIRLEPDVPMGTAHNLGFTS